MNLLRIVASRTRHGASEEIINTTLKGAVHDCSIRQR